MSIVTLIPESNRKAMNLKILRLISLPILIGLCVSTVSGIDLPYNQSFSSEGIPSGWTQQVEGEVTDGHWFTSNSSQAGGQPYEMKIDWTYEYGVTRLVMPPIETDSVMGILLSFRQKLNDYNYGVAFKIQSSADGENWTDENWVHYSGTGNIPATTTALSISHNMGDTTYIAFVIIGDHYEFNNWMIDDVSVSQLTGSPDCSALVYPPNGSENIPTNLTFSWTPIPQAYQYWVYVGTDTLLYDILEAVPSNAQNLHIHYGLLPGTQYFWKIVPVNVFGYALNCDIWTFTTREADTLPFQEQFNAETLPEAWVEQDSGVYSGWYIWPDNYAGGTPNELEFDYQPLTGKARFISPPIDASGQAGIRVVFNQYFEDADTGMQISIQSSTDAVHWTNSTFMYHSGNGSIGPVQDTAIISTNLCEHTYVALVIEGNFNAFYYWVVDNIHITSLDPETGSVEGTVKYNNTSSTPMHQTKVYLTDLGDVKIDSTELNALGEFSFASVLPGNYKIKVASSHAWGGGNALDALLVMKHFVGMTTLTGMKLVVANVDGSTFANSVDALLIMKRFVNMIPSFPMGNWYFENPQISVESNTVTTVSIKGLCFGDTDGSFLP